jgi:hypothetical protein
MVLPAIIGIILLLVIIYVALKIFKNILLGVALVTAVVFASFLIFGSLPDLRTIPIIGGFIPDLSGILESLYKIEVIAVSKDVQGNLLITVSNTGKLDVTRFKVSIDGQSARIVNSPKDPLKPGETTVIQAEWIKEFLEIKVETEQTSIIYKK